MTTWDATFEASPSDSDEAKYGASKIRELKVAISERLELELNFKTGTQPLVKAGKAAVIFLGTTADINALSGMSSGALAWDTTLKVLKRYSGSAWVVLDIDHGALSGLSDDDDHPQYLKLDKAGQTLSQNLAVSSSVTIDGRDISADGAKLDTFAATLKFLATPTNKISWTAATDWTDVDISADTGGDTAKGALLNVTLRNSYGYGMQTGHFRKNGSAVTANLARIINSGGHAAVKIEFGNAMMVIVECDASEIFETKLVTDSGTGTYSYVVDLIGYFI